MKQKNLKKLFDKPMDRKQFLAHIGAGALIITGISGLLKGLVNLDAKSNQDGSVGYGSSSYGGSKK